MEEDIVSLLWVNFFKNIFKRSNFKDNNRACCFGCSEQGQLGTGSSNSEIIPCALDTIQENIISIACGYSHTLILTENQQIYSTGNNSNGELGVGHKKSSYLPIKIMMLENLRIKSIAASDFSAAVTEKGELYLWGSFGFSESIFPQKINLKNKIVHASIGSQFGICLDSTGALFGWGNNPNGELAQGDFEPKDNLNQIFALNNKTIKEFSCGGNFVIALGNTVNKKLEDGNNQINLNSQTINTNANGNPFIKENNSKSSFERNNNSVDFLEIRKAKSQHMKPNHQHNRSLEDPRVEDPYFHFKKNSQNSIRYLTNEEIKNRQKATIYESPNRITDKYS